MRDMGRQADVGAILGDPIDAMRVAVWRLVLQHHRARRIAYRAYLAAHNNRLKCNKGLIFALLTVWHFLSNLERVSLYLLALLARLVEKTVGLLLLAILALCEPSPIRPPPDTPVKLRITIPNAPNLR